MSIIQNDEIRFPRLEIAIAVFLWLCLLLLNSH
jgi:hypothetical protein